MPDLGYGREVEMVYDGKEKSLKISSEGVTYIHKDENWPDEVYFVFSLAHQSDKISIISN